LGLGVRGPGCGAPSRYMDMMSYYPWVEHTLSKFRPDNTAYQGFGNCDEEEKINLIYREMISLRTDNNQYQFLTYNMSIYDDVEYTCLTLELVNASAVSEMRIKHLCTRFSYGPPCYAYKGSVFEISVYIMFSDSCRFEMFAWGFHKNMTLIDIQQWKWEEGTFYEDFTMAPVEYRGPAHMTTFGFEPVDYGSWVPEYDIWTTTEFSNITTTTTVKPQDIYDSHIPPPNLDTHIYVASSTVNTTEDFSTTTIYPIFELSMTGKPDNSTPRELYP
ncbi:unnamed protein product, partial [Leptidea sinapis]